MSARVGSILFWCATLIVAAVLLTNFVSWAADQEAHAYPTQPYDPTSYENRADYPDLDPGPTRAQFEARQRQQAEDDERRQNERITNLERQHTP